ncbi:biotin carboxyl carrier domain-containing protein [Saccharopolyspora rhizosphaerae]|uniref:Biotin carboxyl carrier protein of acetyl-CoA carboxylase n=1 Tax=Saccharopolyspora rhizosphaerae TaxID=2492662 RepID=A0A426JLT6_9PSEU|nr:acetyl-CoA carboxylase [Saccharopolyspora rhizosphaerae]RRO14124.1 biotin carboxyl carrier domain-containing protein [Saccharopolyspora rhizosphaerae]
MSTVDAQMPGVFYRRPSPDADPYIEPGTVVQPGQTLGLIEVMKTFNEIKAEKACRVKEVLLEDGEEVDIGQSMFEVDDA